jgi:hypothetical protein
VEAELIAKRAEREVALRKRQDALKEAHLKKKAEEEAARQKEIEQILKEEANKKKREEVTDSMVKEAQERVARESNFGSFSWQ